VRFSLQDVKKSIRRRGDELFVSLHFLRSGELHAEIECLIAYHEGLLGQPQRCFSPDDARACVGDYRLAHCLIATLSNWYRWLPREWSAALQSVNAPPDLDALASPIQLRLALYDYVNERYRGFLDTEARAQALQEFAALYQVSVPDLEYLLALDSEEEALLVRSSPQPPTASEVAALYNQWAFESALFNASSVRFVVDCNAFAKTADQRFTAASVGTGIGAAIKRLCYLARLLGVYYDLAYETPILPGQAPPGLTPLLSLTLYGPQEVTGAPQQYGLRLARLCRLLLLQSPPNEVPKQMAAGQTLPGRVYVNRSQNSTGGSHAEIEGRRGKAGRVSLASAIVEAEATVHFLQRSYHFSMDAGLLALLPAPGETEQRSGERNGGAPASPIFDSSIEQSFSEAFTALAESQGVDNWRLEREPEPLLLDHGIFIPDFALTRGQRRIYVEILGFWTPAYRERKIQKLQQLQGRDDLLLAIPRVAQHDFASIIQHFPVVIYDEQLSATEVLQVLRSRYDDFAERLASIDSAALREHVRREGLVAESACYDLLHCYRRSELPLAAARVIDADIVFTPGIGLYDVQWLEQVKDAFVGWLSTPGSASLHDVLREMRRRWPALANCEDATIEALLALWPEVRVQRDSIFDATIEIAGAHENAEEMGSEQAQEIIPDKGKKRIVRERHSIKRKSTSPEKPTQENLWE
jgi:predicted nuclease of restriction endonuclease-like RecB superfamily